MINALSEFATDIRFALRMMRKSAFASATIIVCLGFSVGATGTVFAWTESIILQPVPGIADPGGLASIRTVTTRGDANVSYPTFRDIRDENARASAPVFTALAAMSIRRFALRTEPAGEADLKWA